MFAKLKNSLKKSSALFSKISSIFSKNTLLDADTLIKFEELLLMSDMGYSLVQTIVNDLKIQKFNKITSENEVLTFLENRINSIISQVAQCNSIEYYIHHNIKPVVLMLFGVNGNGKTTTAGKLAYRFKNMGYNVLLGPCDTFRAAAFEQLAGWADRIGVEMLVQEGDQATVGYKNYIEAQKRNADILILDTAGRLHNKVDLMNELEKSVRVLKKIDPAAPHETLMIIDSTTGQNAYNQIEQFNTIVPMSGLIFTKLDSSAKGGVIIGALDKYKIPIYSIGIGEQDSDLINFHPSEFTKSLLS